MSTLVRPPRPDEAAALVALHHRCWQEAYAGLLTPAQIDAPFADREARLRRWRDIIAAGRTRVVERDQELVGFASCGPARDPDPPLDLELYAIYTRAAEWGRGTGHALLSAVLDERPAYLWVLDGNARAIAFYERHGFVLDGGVDDSEPEGRHLRLSRTTGGVPG